MRRRRSWWTMVAAILIASTGTAAAGSPAETATPNDVASSYRFRFSLDFTINGASTFAVTTKGTFVGPADARCIVSAAVQGASIRERGVSVGEERWLDTGDGFAPDPSDRLQFGNLCPSSDDFWSVFDPASDLAGAVAREPDTINGIEATRLDFSSAEEVFPGLGATIGIPEGVTVDDVVVWRSEADPPMVVGFSMRFSAEDADVCGEVLDGGEIPGTESCTLTLSLRLSRVDDPDLAVEAPKVPGTGSSSAN